jgi:hypothetical protein
MIKIGDTVELGHISQEFVDGQLTITPTDAQGIWGLENERYEYIVYTTGLVIMKEKDES